MKKRGLYPVFLALLLLTAPNAYPQSSEEELELIYGDSNSVSIATGRKQPLSKAPSVASVITAEDIAAMGATDLDEVLEAVAGMHVSRSAVDYTPLYVIRGIFSPNNPQTLMLQNGIPTTTMFTGSKGNIWGGLPLDNVARIEIIRGPGSALYGADAYAGVINIITKSAAETQGTQLQAHGGSFNTRNAWVQHGGNWGEIDVAAYVRVGSTDGHKQTINADAQSARDNKAPYFTQASLAPGTVNTGYDSVDGSLDLAYGQWRLRGGYKLRNNLETGAGIASALDPVGKSRSERITSDISWTELQLSQHWGVGLSASYLGYKETVPTPLVLYPAGVTFPTGTFPDGMIGAPEKWERNIRLSAFTTYAGFDDHQIRIGIGHDDLNMYRTAERKNFTLSPVGLPIPIGAITDFSDTAPFMRPQRRKIDYLYAQDEWNLAKDWTLTSGLRHDKYSDFGTTTNPRLALVWDATLDLTAKLLYGHAFRAPSFVEQYSINNPVQTGNPNLRPETIRTLESAFSWQARNDTLIKLSLYRYIMNDIIRLTTNPAPAVGSTYNNKGSQHGSGMELETAWDYSRKLRLTGNYSYQKSIDDSTGQDAGYAPHHHFYLRGDWRYSSGWQVSTQIDHVADRRRAAGDNRPQIADYTTVDIFLRSPTVKQWSASSSLRNLFNADVREPSQAPGLIPNDLPMAPRSLWLQVTYSL